MKPEPLKKKRWCFDCNQYEDDKRKCATHIGFKPDDIKLAIEWFKAKIFFIDKKEDILKVFDESFEDIK